MIPLRVSAFLVLAVSMIEVQVVLAQATSGAPNSQDSSREWVRPERPQQPLTAEQIDAAIATYWVGLHDQDSDSQALDYLEYLIHAGDISADSTEAVRLLQRLSTEGIREQVRAGGDTVNNFPLIRARAAALLGRIGGTDALDAVIAISTSDPSPDVRAAAVTAMAQIARNPTERELDALREVLELNNSLWQNATLAYAALTAVKSIYLLSSGPEAPGLASPRRVAPNLKNPALYRAVTQIGMGTYPQSVRQLAIEVMNVIRDAKNR